jgi:hypothetical protein
LIYSIIEDLSLTTSPGPTSICWNLELPFCDQEA